MKVSIITATYNSANTVEDTLRSVLSQSYDDIEHIIVDGASKDNTMEIVRSYESKYNGRLRYISEPDKGLYDAMNKGFNMATGDVIGILNSDDFYSSSKSLETLIDKLKESQADAVYADVRYVAPEDLTKTVRYYSSKIFRRRLMRLGFMPAHPSFYCKSEVYKKWGMFDTSYKIAADFEQLLRLIYVNKIKTAYIDIDVVTMRAGGISNANMSSRFAIMRDHKRALKKNGVYSNVAILSLRYVYKSFELSASFFKRIFRKRK